MALKIKIGIIENCRDTTVKTRSIEWSQLTERLKNPDIRSRKDGKAILFASFARPYRKAENVVSVSAFGFDVEINKTDGTHPPVAANAAEILSSKPIESVIYTTHSHTPTAPRYRIIIPLDRPIGKTDIKLAFDVVADWLPELSRWFDTTCKEPARLFYLPAAHPDRASEFEFYHITGEVLSAATIESMIDAKKAEIEAHRVERLLKQTKYQPKNGGDTGEGVIQQFNRTFCVDEILQSHDYIKKGKRWLSPESSSGVAGVHVFHDGKVFSHHGDILSQGGLCDAFQAFCQLEHGGNMTNAVKAAAKLLQVVA